MSDRVRARQFYEEAGSDAWRVFPEGAYAAFQTGDFTAAVRLVSAIADLVPPGHEPDVDVRGSRVTVLLRALKGEAFGLYPPDLDLAKAIVAAAAEHGAIPDPDAIQSLLVIPGAVDPSAIIPFWRAVLAYVPRADSPEEDLVDPLGRGAPFWFEAMDEPRADGDGTMHLVVWLPWDQAEARVAAGLAAGGRLVRHNEEEGFWTLADPAGNEVDIALTASPF